MIWTAIILCRRSRCLYVSIQVKGRVARPSNGFQTESGLSMVKMMERSLSVYGAVFGITVNRRWMEMKSAERRSEVKEVIGK
jgi:hypothetical protein